MDFIEIKKLADVLRISETICTKLVLNFSTNVGIKLMHQLNGVTIIPERLKIELLQVIDYLDNSLTDYEIIKANKLDKIPFLGDGFIYYLFNNDELVYIGQSTNLGQRIGTHFKSDKVFNLVYAEPVDKKDLLLIESFYIYRDRPVLNTEVMTKEQYIISILNLIDMDLFL